VHAVDVERGQPFVDKRRELRRQRRLLDVVFALKQINRVGVARGELLSDVGWSSRQNASKIADTMVRANSVLNRSSALVSCPKNAVGSIAVWPVWLPVASYS
jgi:hypothetical protein